MSSIPSWVLQDQKRAMVNELIRLHTPNDDSPEERKWEASIHKCIWSNPLTIVEGLGLILTGVAVCPSQVVGIRGLITTQHESKSVSVEACTLDLGCPLLPCFFQDDSVIISHSFTPPDEYTTTREAIHNEGCKFNGHCGTQEKVAGSLPNTKMTSSLTASDCLMAGIHSIQRALFEMICCPISVCCHLCNLGHKAEFEILVDTDDKPKNEVMNNI